MTAAQLMLPITPDLADRVKEFLRELSKSRRRPSVHELIEQLDCEIGPQGRWDLLGVLRNLGDDHSLTWESRDFFLSLAEGDDLKAALKGAEAPRLAIQSSVDALLRETAVYRSSAAFTDMIEFMARFRNYAPYNNMLVRTQNPSCGFFASARDWENRFRRTLKEDARPMLILAPMHPVMLVYDLDQTEGPPLPEKLQDFARFEGEWDRKGLPRLTENAERHKIRVQFKPLSSTLGGFAEARMGAAQWKRRIVIHDALDDASRFGVLCHEVAHILLGHLGGDPDGWWPARSGIDRATAEIEAEAVAYLVTTRLGLSGSSAPYLSGYLTSKEVPHTVSLDWIAKIAGFIERMAQALLPPPKPKPPRQKASVK